MKHACTLCLCLCLCLRYCVTLAFALCGLGAGAVAMAANWPALPMPPRVSSFDVGEQLTVNGLPMRVQGFVSQDMSVAELADWYRRSLGQPLVEDRRGTQLILGRGQGGYYLSVQMEPAGRHGSKGLLAVSDLAGMNRNREQDMAANERWLLRWPSGSQIISRTASKDSGKTALHLVLRNAHSEELNRDALVDVLQQDGLKLEREVAASGSFGDQLSASQRSGKAYFFNGDGKEAMATIARDEQGQTTIVFTTVTTLKRYAP